MKLSRLALLISMVLVAGACDVMAGTGTLARFGEATQQMGITGFPVGSSVVLEHKAVKGNPVTVIPDVWTNVGAITIPSGGHYVVTLQIRMPRGAWAESRMVRIGWGRDSDGRDETGYHTFVARPDGRATSESFTHALAGGGPLAFEINVHTRRKGHLVGPLGPVKLATVVCKAHRTD